MTFTPVKILALLFLIVLIVLIVLYVAKLLTLDIDLLALVIVLGAYVGGRDLLA